MAARAWALMSQYGWTLWAAIQDAISPIDFDYWSWGMEKYERAVAEFDSPLFEDRLAVLGDACDPGFGYDMVRLSAMVTERIDPAQTGLDDEDHDEELAHLIDRLGARFGRDTRRLARDEERGDPDHHPDHQEPDDDRHGSNVRTLGRRPGTWGRAT